MLAGKAAMCLHRCLILFCLFLFSNQVLATWTPPSSEEQAENTNALCDQAISQGIRCQGRYCDEVSLKCSESLYQVSELGWSEYFSEENPAGVICRDNSYVSGLRCRGKFCDELSLKCSQVEGFKRNSCYWSAPFSEEDGGEFVLPTDTYLAGLKCEGDYCDSKRAYICQAENLELCENGACADELARKFAPLLRFDQAQGQENKCFPGKASEYFAKRKSGDSSRICNTDYSTILNGEIPVYYDVSSCGSKETIIKYWFFYGYQDSCGFGLGSHDADWERIAIKIVDGKLETVMFYQHGGHYSKDILNVELYEGRPVVYVGKNSHGSYHDAGGSGSCLYFDDHRNPGPLDMSMQTWMNLVALSKDSSSPEWMRYQGREFWDGYQGPLARGVELCSMSSCGGKDFSLGSNLCLGQCGCLKSDTGSAPFSAQVNFKQISSN